MRRAFLMVSAGALLCAPVWPASPSCWIGAKCIKSQGTSIPVSTVHNMLDRCGEFTAGGVGRRVLRMSIQQIQQASGGNILHPVFSAYHAFTELYDSPLLFDRQSNVESTNYEQIASACAKLSRDYETWLNK
ncbi:hypothetical protein [Alicycliphilus denitrificans]|uniref:hypothetical protein n=1 Tax=Alicycliphilus denitrificans TaxID=179636 RepID=UPI0011AF5379|nr:hypothetical protein [Alicycliphilus denitrificans]